MKTVHLIGDSIAIHYGPYLAVYIAPYAPYSRKTSQIGNLDSPEGALADAVAAAKGVGVIDLYTFCQSLGGAEMDQDHVHFTPQVQRLQAAFIAGAVKGFLVAASVPSGPVDVERSDYVPSPEQGPEDPC